LIKQELAFMTMFEQAALHPNAHLIIGLICRYRIEACKNEGRF
jgi:hypothetical protein